MGSGYSHPIASGADTGGFVCMTLRMYNKFRVLHAPPDVVDMASRVVNEVSGKSIVSKDKYGSVQFKLPGRPFYLTSGKDSATVGKVLASRLLEEMYAMGYDFVTSSDLSRLYDLSSWFFVKVVAERPKQKVICVAPGGFDKIVMVRTDAGQMSAVKQAVEENWRKGIQNESVHQTKSGEVHEFKLKGNPWFSRGEEAAMCRRLIVGIVGHLGRARFRLITPTSLKGGTDTLFFIYDENYYVNGPHDFAMISLNRSDRIRLINFDESMNATVRSSIRATYMPDKDPEEQIYHGTYEFKLKGSPFFTSGDGTVATRGMICKILEDVAARGWDCIDCMDVSRKVTDKSVFIFKRVPEPLQIKYACVCLSDVDHLRFINFPPHVKDALRDTLHASYMPGVQKELERDAYCHKIYLNRNPWGYHTSDGLHARSMLTQLLKVAAQHGWYLRGSADVSAKYMHQENGPDYPLDVHSWFMCTYSSKGGM